MQIRKIETPEEMEKKDRRNKLIIGIILVGVMILSTAGFAFLNRGVSNNAQKQVYNGYEFFINDNGFWQTQIQGQAFQFQYSPNETQEISLKIDFNSFYAGKPLYFSSENPEAINEISSNIARFLPRAQNTCVLGEECKEDLPEKDCEIDNIVIIKESNATNVSMKSRCVFIEGAYSDLVKLSDSFLYKILGVK